MYMVNPRPYYTRMDQAELKAMQEQAEQAHKKNEEAWTAAAAEDPTGLFSRAARHEAGPTMLGFPRVTTNTGRRYKISESIRDRCRHDHGRDGRSDRGILGHDGTVIKAVTRHGP